MSFMVEADSARHPCPGVSRCTGAGTRALDSLEISAVPASAHHAQVQPESQAARAEMELVHVAAMPDRADYRLRTYRATRPRGHFQ